jgi:glutathione reductase (NADPH)
LRRDSVLSIEPTIDEFVVRYRRSSDHLTARAERVANGAGREADLDGPDLTAGRVQHDGARISVDTGLRSVSNSRVYVAGDTLWSTPQLSPVATYEGQIIGRAILEGRTIEPEYRMIPSCVYSIPILASVGLTEKEARQRGNDLDVKVHDLRTWRSARTYAERFAYSKILIDRATDQVVGANILGYGGEEAINLLAFAMKHRVPATELRQTVFGYPTFSSDR